MKKLIVGVVLAMAPAMVFANSYDQSTIVAAGAGGPNGVNVGSDSVDMAFDTLGNAGLCYFDDTNNDLKFALYDGNNWAIETADNGGVDNDTVGENCALIFDDDDVPNIVYHNATDRSLIHAQKNGARWLTRIVDNAARTDFFAVSRVSIAKDGQGAIAVAYYDATNRDLKYAKFAAGNWTVATVRNAGDVGRYASLDFDSNNNPAIAYQDYTDNNTASLKLISYANGGWRQPETVDSDHFAGGFIAFKFDAHDKPHLVYRHVSADGLYSVFYTNKVGNTWGDRYALAQQVGPATGYYNRMAIDANGNVHILYFEQFLSALFPDVNYLKLTTLYFADRGYASMGQSTNNLAFSVIPMVDYAGMAIAVDNDYHLFAGWAQENGVNFDLHIAKLTSWSPAMVMLTPNVNNKTGRDTFELTWLDFDPDSNARIRFNRLDADFNSVDIAETAREDGANSVVIDLTGIPSGEYSITATISDDDFAMFSSHWAPARLMVEARQAQAPADQGQQNAQAGGNNQQQANAGNNNAGGAQQANLPNAGNVPVDAGGGGNAAGAVAGHASAGGGSNAGSGASSSSSGSSGGGGGSSGNGASGASSSGLPSASSGGGCALIRL